MSILCQTIHRRTINTLLAFVGALLASSLAIAADDVDLLEQQAYQAAVERVSPSVVRIETIGGLEQVGKVQFGTGPTTGLVVAEDGYLMSSAFNFSNRPSSILVQLPDGTRKPAQLVATDHNRMLALLKIDVDKPLPVPQFARQDEVRVGQWAIGLGRAFDVGQPNVSVGIISAVNRIWGKAIQTDAAVSPNNYGGPLVNLRGEVLGLLVPLSPEGNDEVAGVEWYDSGIGFAIPGEDVKQIFLRLKDGKDLHPGLGGLRFASRNLHIAEPVISGAHPNSPAYKAGLRDGDKIVEVAGRKIGRAAQIKEELSRRYAGDTVGLVALRDNKPIEAVLQLVEKLEPYDTPFLGILPIRPALTKDNSPAEPAGVAVRYVYPKSPAAEAGIQASDVVTSLAGTAITDAASLRRRISDFEPKRKVDVEIRRGSETLKLAATLGRLPEEVPSNPLPVATGAVDPGADQGGEKVQVGKVRFRVGTFPNEVWAYIPEDYRPTVAQGLVLWIHGKGGVDVNEVFAQWKPACDHDHVILVAAKAADPDAWKRQELALLEGLLSQLCTRYTIDSTRITVVGCQQGGALASVLAYGQRDSIRALALIESPVIGAAPENDPEHRLAFYVAQSTGKGAITDRGKMIDLLRKQGYPVTVKDLGETPRDLIVEEQAELARWIDTLDRI